MSKELSNDFSVAMCVYGKDNPNWFEKAIESISINQTIKPKEIVLVVDGPVQADINAVIDKYNRILGELQISLNTIRLEKNTGHGNARKISIDNCLYDLIALMDSDDISRPNRFEVQLEYIDKSDCVGSNILEFDTETEQDISYRTVPEKDGDIKQFAKYRCPMNQMTVMFKKKAYIKAGGYIDWYQDEDYYLWIRMMETGASFYNVRDVLVNVRAGNYMLKRRGGIKYYRSEKKLQRYMLIKGIISLPEYIINCSKRFIVQVLLPNTIRAWVFKKYARSSINEEI